MLSKELCTCETRILVHKEREDLERVHEINVTVVYFPRIITGRGAHVDQVWFNSKSGQWH